MDITELLSYIDLVTMGICLCIGYSLKITFSGFPNRWIPLTMLATGTIINILIAKSIDGSIILGGMISGLASTGSYEMLRNLLDSYNKQ